MIKPMLAILVLLCCTASVAAQNTTVIMSYQTVDASQFGYKSWDQGVSVSVSQRIKKRWEGTIAAGISNAAKAYVGDGKHVDAAFNVKFYISESFFALAGLTGGIDSNSQYEKTAIRGVIGVGGKFYDFVGTLTLFSAPTDLAIDANQVRGVNLTVEYFKPMFGPVGLYTAFQTSLASFNQTGGPLSERFSGVVWKARAGIYLSF